MADTPKPTSPSSGAVQPTSNPPPVIPPADDRTRVSHVVQDTQSALPDMNLRRHESRRERNRQHARASRERKQVELQTLLLENVRLRNSMVNLEREIADGAKEINDLRALYERSMSQNLNLRRQLQSSNPANIPHNSAMGPGHDR